MSSVIKLGVDNTFAPEMVETALNREENAKFFPKLVIEPTFSPRPKGAVATAPAVPSTALIAALAPMMFVLPEVVGPIKFVPAKAVFELLSACH